MLVAGGFSDFGLRRVVNSAELYNPDTGIWSITGNLNKGRAYHTATLTPDGKVLLAGGFVDFLNRATNSAELYDPATGLWTDSAALNAGRRFHTATLLPNGKILVAAGNDGANPLSSAELYVPGPNPIDDAQFFVRQQYLDFLSREPDQVG